MNKKIANLVVAFLFAVSCMACSLVPNYSTVGTYSSGTYNAPDGKGPFDTQVTKDLDWWGLDGKTMNLYRTTSVFNPVTKHWEPQTVLVAHGEGFTDGFGKQLTMAVVKGILDAGGWIAGAYLFNSAGQVVGTITNTVTATGGKATAKANAKANAAAIAINNDPKHNQHREFIK